MRRNTPCHQEDEMSKRFETEFTKAFMKRFLDIKKRPGSTDSPWPADERISAARLRDLNTYTRLLLSGAQTGRISIAFDAGTMDRALFTAVKGFMKNFALGATKGWPETTEVSARQKRWKSQDIDVRALRMAEASVLISRLIAASAMNPPGGGNDKVKFPIKPY
jgi:hypothetical protein